VARCARCRHREGAGLRRARPLLPNVYNLIALTNSRPAAPAGPALPDPRQRQIAPPSLDFLHGRAEQVQPKPRPRPRARGSATTARPSLPPGPPRPSSTWSSPSTSIPPSTANWSASARSCPGTTAHPRWNRTGWSRP